MLPKHFRLRKIKLVRMVIIKLVRMVIIYAFHEARQERSGAVTTLSEAGADQEDKKEHSDAA